MRCGEFNREELAMLLVEPSTLDHLPARRREPPPELPQMVQRRLRYLLPADRTLLEMVYQLHLSRRQIAPLVNMAPGTVTRKVKRLVNRLCDPVVSALTDERCALDPTHRALAIGYFLHGKNAAQLARASGLPTRDVQAALEFIRGWYRGVSQRMG